jgi:hypothetical protein
VARSCDFENTGAAVKENVVGGIHKQTSCRRRQRSRGSQSTETADTGSTGRDYGHTVAAASTRENVNDPGVDVDLTDNIPDVRVVTGAIVNVKIRVSGYGTGSENPRIVLAAESGVGGKSTVPAVTDKGAGGITEDAAGTREFIDIAASSPGHSRVRRDSDRGAGGDSGPGTIGCGFNDLKRVVAVNSCCCVTRRCGS